MFDWLLKSSLVQNFANSEIRHGATFLSGLVLAWLLSHGFVNDQAANIASGVAAIVIGLGGYGLSKLNQSGTAAVANVAAETGQLVPVPVARALVKGDTVALPDGQQITLGKPSPANQTEAQEEAEAAALNKSQLPK